MEIKINGTHILMIACVILIAIAGFLFYELQQGKTNKTQPMKTELAQKGIVTNQTPQPMLPLLVNCDGLLASYQNDSTRVRDSTGALTLWSVKCLEYYGEIPKNFDDALKVIKTCVIVKGKQYGDCAP